MRGIYKIASIIVVVLILGLTSFLLLKGPEETPTETPQTPTENVQADFTQSEKMYLYVDVSGNADVSYIVEVPPSEFASHSKNIIGLIGVDEIKDSYLESIQSSLARYGLEVKEPTCEVTGLSEGENLKITITWDTPSIAHWEDNKWTLELDFADPESGAKEVIAEEESSWMSIRTIAQTYGVQNPLFKDMFVTALVLPKNAENISTPLIGSVVKTYYGGGSYSKSSLKLGQVNGRPAVIENGFKSIATENEITVTSDEFLENNLSLTVTYRGVNPENKAFINSLEPMRLDLKYGCDLNDNYSIYSGDEWYSLTPTQVLYYSAKAITDIDQGNQISVQEPLKEVVSPSIVSGDWSSCWENFSKSGYVSLAQTIQSNLDSANQASGTSSTSIGEIRYIDALYTFVRVLHSYNQSGTLPSEVKLAPVPSGTLTWRGNQISAKQAYFLLPDTYVKIDTGRANEVLENIRDNYGNFELGGEICDWTGSNISYGLSYTPPTSEEVLETKTGQCRDFTNVYMALARTAGLPSRRMNGWIRSDWTPPAGWEFIVGTTPEGKTVANHAWSQVYLPEKGWVDVEPQSTKPNLYVDSLPYEVYRQLGQTWIDALAGYETAKELL